VSNNKNVMFFVFDPFGNRVVLYEKTWLLHTAPKHNAEFNVTTSFFPDPPYLSRNVGEIFWVNSDAGKDKEK
jgi:hypothetical protein